MGCGCKAKRGDESPVNNKNNPKVNIGVNIIHYSVKLIGFFIGLALLPIIVLMIIYFMFKLIVVSKDVDIKPLFVSLAKLMKQVAKDNADEDDDDDDDDDNEAEWENVDPDEFELVGVDDITKK